MVILDFQFVIIIQSVESNDSDLECIDNRTFNNQLENENSVPLGSKFIDYQNYEMTRYGDFNPKISSRIPKRYQKYEYREDSIVGRKKGVVLNQPTNDRRRRQYVYLYFSYNLSSTRYDFHEYCIQYNINQYYLQHKGKAFHFYLAPG